MALSLRKKSNISTIVSSSDSSDYDDAMPSKKARLQKTKSVQKKLRKLCNSDENLSNGAKTDMHRNTGNGHLNVRIINTKNTTNQEEVSNDTDTDSREPVKSINQDSDGSSYNSSDSLMESQRKFKKLSNNRKTRSNEIKIQKETKTYKDHSSNSNSSDIIMFPRQKIEGKRSEQETVQDFKPLVTKIGKELSHKFSKFKTQINEVQSKYVKNDIVSLQDAGQTLFIFNCIISKLKEELTEEQQHLTNSYIQWSTKHKCNHTVSNIQNKQCTKSIANDNNLQVQNKSLQSTSNNNVQLADAYKRKSLGATKNLQEIVQGDDKVGEHHQNIRNGKGKQPLEVMNIVSIPQTSNDNGMSENNHNAMSQNNHNLLSGLSDLSMFKLAETSAKISKINKEKSKEKTFLYSETLSSSSRDSQELSNMERNLSMNELRTEGAQIINCDSDVSSTCSTVALFPRETIDMQQIEEYENNLTQADEFRHEDELENLIVNNIFNECVNDKVAVPRLFRSDSNDTVIIPLSETNNSNVQSLNDKQNKNTKMPAKTSVAPSNKENSISQEDSNFILPVPSIKSHNATHCSFLSSRNSEIEKENNNDNKRTDNKLQMNCQVLVKKFKL